MDFKPAITRQLLGRRVRNDRRTIHVTRIVDDQQTFDQLFALLFQHDRALVVRSANAVDYITKKNPEFLIQHKAQLLTLFNSGDNRDLKQYLPKLISRIRLTQDEMSVVWTKLGYLTKNPNESKSVRLNALQALHDISVRNRLLSSEFTDLIQSLNPQQVQALQSRIKKLVSE